MTASHIRSPNWRNSAINSLKPFLNCRNEEVCFLRPVCEQCGWCHTRRDLLSLELTWIRRTCRLLVIHLCRWGGIKFIVECSFVDCGWRCRILLKYQGRPWLIDHRLALMPLWTWHWINWSAVVVLRSILKPFLWPAFWRGSKSNGNISFLTTRLTYVKFLWNWRKLFGLVSSLWSIFVDMVVKLLVMWACTVQLRSK